MRVLYISRGGNPHDHRFLSALAETEHEMYFLPLESTAAVERPLLPRNVEILEGLRHSDGSGSSGATHDARSLKHILDEIQPDLVHAGPMQSGAYLAAQCDWHPLVSMSWGSDLLVDAEGGEGREVAEYALKRSDVLVCDCETVRQAAVELGVPDNHVVVFPWGVDLERFSPGQEGELRDELGWQDAIILLSTRAWEPIYGADVIVKAFIQASRNEPSLRLVMLSEGSLRAGLLAELEGEGALGLVHAPGGIKPAGLPPFYRTADLYVSASHSDGSSISLLEAMACGVPALVSDIPGNQEWVIPERTGWWFEDGDADQLASWFVCAATARDQLPGMGSHAREVAEASADWNVNFGRLLEAYDMAASVVQVQQ
ncbi:MAG: glycosyltransferase family 4 protein [Anaerolineales bacterium]